MPEEKPIGCARPTGGVVAESSPHNAPNELREESIQGRKSMIAVGKPAPDFTAHAFFDGRFVSVRLSEYLGKWVVLCFYPGDFTFV